MLTGKNFQHHTFHCIKRIYTTSYSGPHFPIFRVNTETCSISLRLQSKIGKMGPEKLQIRTLFTHWYVFACYLVQSPSTKFLLINKHRVLRWFYTRLNISRMLRRHRFFLFGHAHAQKGFFTDKLLKCRSRWKFEIIWTFLLRTNVAFFKLIIFV